MKLIATLKEIVDKAYDADKLLKSVGYSNLNCNGYENFEIHLDAQTAIDSGVMDEFITKRFTPIRYNSGD